MAPNNFSFEADGHCYVKRQPGSAAELEIVLRVVRTQELGCIRYRGADKEVLRRLAEAGEAEQCDLQLSPPVAALSRNCARFAIKPGVQELTSAEVLEALRAALLVALGDRARATAISVDGAGRATMAIAWFEDAFHRIELEPLGEGKFHLRHLGPGVLSELLDDELRQEPYAEVVWSTSPSGENSASRPW